MSLDQLKATAEIAAQIKQNFQDDKMSYYVPCCQTHKLFDDKGKFVRNNCPVIPCPNSKHTKFHLSTKRIRIIFGGNRSSKSISGLAELLIRACFKKNIFTGEESRSGGRYRIYASDFGIIEKLILPLVKSWIPKSALKGNGKSKAEAWENSWDNKYHILYLKGDTTIDFMSYDQDASKSESVDLDGVWADEQMPEAIYSAVLARLLTRKGRLWMTVTPLYDISWAMRFLDGADPDIDVFIYEIYDNPYVPKEAIEEFERTVPEHEKEARLRGQFIELQGLVYKELEPSVHLIDHVEPQFNYPVVFALDPHPRKASVMTWAYVNPMGDVIFFDELEMKGTAAEIAGAIRAKESGHKAKVRLRLIDPAAKAQGSNISGYGTDTLREFEKEGIYFTLADNSDAGYNTVHEYLSYNKKIPVDSLNRPQCLFTRNVPKTWAAMSRLLWDEWRVGSVLRDEKERIRDYKKDFPDCVRYTVVSRPSFNSFSNTGPVKMKMSMSGGIQKRSLRMVA